jgi:accessory gene regulator B
MLESLCHTLAKNINQNELDEEEEILIFGIHYLINYLMILIIAILFGLLTTSLFETFLFLLIVLPIRTVQGGIHFKSSLLCFIVSISLCIVPYLLMHIDFNHLLLFPLALLSIFLLFITDVLDNRNNPMTDKELRFLNK